MGDIKTRTSVAEELRSAAARLRDTAYGAPLVLAELAALTESCGPWAAARTLFNPINEGGDQR